MSACDISDVDADALLPPRKRLLAGLKRQVPDANFSIPAMTGSAGSEFDARLNHHLRSHLANPSMTTEEIVEASRRAASEATKIAEAARANAEDKAARAAKAVVAAKSALELVATLSEDAFESERHLKRNKLKKHIPVESLYNKNKRKNNCRSDEELARNLHRSINSSPRISKSISSSDGKNKHKRLKSSISIDKTFIASGGPIGEGNQLTNNGEGNVDEVTAKGPVKEIDMVIEDPSKPEKVGQRCLNLEEEEGSKLKLGEQDAFQSQDNIADSSYGLGKKRGKLKKKKLPLSMCNFREQTGPQDPKDMPQSEDNASRAVVGKQPLFPDRSSMWKCHALKAPPSVEKNKVLQL